MAANRPSAGKTATIKQRRVKIYLPSLETKEAWTTAAERRKQSISEMVFHLVHERLSGEDESATKRVGVLETQLENAHGQVAELRKRVQDLETLNDRMESGLEQYRAQAFVAGAPRRPLDSRLVRILAEAKDRSGKKRAVSDLELKRTLKVAPKDETKAKALFGGLAELETHGFIARTNGGWIWNGE